MIGVAFPDADVIGSSTTPWEYDTASRLTDIPGLLNDADYAAWGVAVTYAYGPDISVFDGAAVEKRARAPDQDGR